MSRPTSPQQERNSCSTASFARCYPPKSVSFETCKIREAIAVIEFTCGTPDLYGLSTKQNGSNLPKVHDCAETWAQAIPMVDHHFYNSPYAHNLELDRARVSHWPLHSALPRLPAGTVEHMMRLGVGEHNADGLQPFVGATRFLSGSRG